jgi:ABC-type antimicrobial peptide transport system permease subunit
MALGAEPLRVITMVLREAAVLVAVGLAIGLPAALAAGGLVTAQLFHVRSGDPGTVITAMGFLLLVAGAASYLPARRAARVQPTEALRPE